MKPISLLLLFLVVLPAGRQVASQVHAQEDWGKKFNSYEMYKKEIATGYLLSSLLPGGGMFYTDNIGLGVVFLAGTSGLVAWTINAESDRSVPVIAIVIARLVEYIIVAEEVNAHNAQLRKQLNLAIDYSPAKGPTLQLSFNF